MANLEGLKSFQGVTIYSVPSFSGIKVFSPPLKISPRMEKPFTRTLVEGKTLQRAG